MNQDVLSLFGPVEEEVEIHDNPPRSLSVRMPFRTHQFVVAMAEHAGVSRSAMAVHLLDWGITYALEHMPAGMADEITTDVDEAEQAED